MHRPVSFDFSKRSYWLRLPSGTLIYWASCLGLFKIMGAWDFTKFWPHYYSAKNGTSLFSVIGLTTVIAFLLFAMATNVASLQMLERDENDFRRQSKRLTILMAVVALTLAPLGQVMVKANKAKEIEAILQLANDLGAKSPAITRLRVQYYSDFTGQNGTQAEATIDDARVELGRKIDEVKSHGWLVAPQ